MRWIVWCLLALPLIGAEPLSVNELLENARFLKKKAVCEAALPLYRRALQHESLTDSRRRAILQEVADCQLQIGDPEGAAASLEQAETLATPAPVLEAELEPEPPVDTTPHVRQALQRIVLPELQIEAGTNVRELTERLATLSKNHDPADQGITLIWVPAPRPAVAEEADPVMFDFSVEDEDTTTKDEPVEASNTPPMPERVLRSPLLLRHIALADVLDILRLLGICQYRIQNGSVLLGPPESALQEMETRFYPLHSEWVAWAKNEDGGEPFDIQNFLRRFGVGFPSGSRATLDSRINKLAIHNTSENLERAETLLNETAPPPPLQVRVTADVIDFQLAEELYDLGPAEITGRGLAALPTELKRRLSRVSVVTREDAELPVAASGSATLTINEVVVADRYSIYLSLAWGMPAARIPDRESPYKLETELLFWDGEPIALQLDHLDGRDRYLIIRATLINPIGLPLRP